VSIRESVSGFWRDTKRSYNVFSNHLAFGAVLWHLRPMTVSKKAYAAGAMMAVAIMIAGCASTTETQTKAPRVDENARWVVVSTNDPVSSARMERDSSRVPPRSNSVLLAPGGEEARNEIENSGVTPILKKKMLDGEVLTVADIEDLGRYKVGEGTILKYLQSTGAIYILNSDDVTRLQQAGVSKAVIDYMLATPNQRPVQVVKRYHRYYYPYYDPWYSWGYPYYHHYHYYPRYYHHHHHFGGHRSHGGGGLRVHRP
jgi:hypothetical protein